ncbi:flagellar basal body L-ring protein FlgH [Roseomonas gilardii]|uniref:Flagellar L-ring protein n=1 Tax=Roseomonas gilardii TaxID=257708 RepID=A0A1L7AGN5_9PROT|nr:flagellar basal body L-ring protein FlgH [Roseomonas gilardii]APT57891.1 flagellar basal body L-ring protein [Roseomonas gilardii]MDT8331447.1 flagellar basal body L-ring protein FlgH [Roseomonas gilardii]PZR16998.1 MAG: flagellar basal body L-ring protein FlgH [Azospirillum brasilense]
MRRVLLLLLPLALAACGSTERLARLGRAPDLADIADPTRDPDWKPVTMPTPAPADPRQLGSNSLWRPGSRTFLRDSKAASVGDLVTVLVSISDKASLANDTERSRDNSEDMGIPRLLGLDASYLRFFPNGFDPTKMISASSANSSEGKGTVKRNEEITLRVAATVTQVLPNGNMVLAGRQQVRVNHELRDLTLAGIIRPQDIASDNTVKHDRLAEARISYGGRGTLSDVQKPRYGQELLDSVLPF